SAVCQKSQGGALDREGKTAPWRLANAQKIVTSSRMTDRDARSSPAKVTVYKLVFMTYSVLCSGAYGLEEMVSDSGPGIALLTIALLPLIWAVPIGLVCAELSARYPLEGGYYRWTKLAFGDFAGYLAGWLVWLASFATNATFAVLFANYLRYFIPELPHLINW